MNSRQISRRLHVFRHRLPDGYTWKIVENDCYTALIQLSVFRKLSDNNIAITIDHLIDHLNRKYNRSLVEIAIWSLTERGRVVSRQGLCPVIDRQRDSV